MSEKWCHQVYANKAKWQVLGSISKKTGMSSFKNHLAPEIGELSYGFVAFTSPEPYLKLLQFV